MEYFSFLNRFSVYNKIQISLEYQERESLTCAWGTLSYMVLPYFLFNYLATFQLDFLSIFVDLLHGNVKLYIDV